MNNLSNRFSKKKVFLMAAIVCCIALVAAGTLAYFTAEETAFNVITTGKLAMDLHDETTGGVDFPANGIDNVMPGNVVDKIVYVENTGSVDFYTRISLEKIIEAAEGVETELDFDKITLNINTKDWTEKGGYYYYNGVVKPGEKTPELFTTVTFGTGLSNEYMEAHVEINVSAEAVQSKNNGTSALTATGWPSEE